MSREPDQRIIEINEMNVSTYDRNIKISYVCRPDINQSRFHIKSEKTDESIRSKTTNYNLWLTEEELDQMIVNLIEAKSRYGGEEF